MARAKLARRARPRRRRRPAPRPARRRPRASPARPRSQAGVRTKARRGGSGGSDAATAASGGRAMGRVSGSSSSKPASVSASSAASSTVRANTPTWSSVRDRRSAPLRGMRPWVGLKPTTPQKAAGPDHRAVGLGADGARHHARPPPPPPSRWRSRPASGSDRAGLARLAGMVVRVLRGHGLAHDHGASGAQPRDDRRVPPRRAARPQGRAELGRHVAGVEDVLDADRHAVERAQRLARLAMRVGGLRLPHRVLAVEERPGLHRRRRPPRRARGRRRPAPPR